MSQTGDQEVEQGILVRRNSFDDTLLAYLFLLRNNVEDGNK